MGAVRRLTPPWLRRTHGARVTEGMADALDHLVERAVHGVKLRFPGAPPRPIDEGALALTGRERRIRRGPREPAARYAARLLTWWDAHRTRGGPYALLEQMRAYFLDSLRVRMDVVYHSGTRRWMDEDGAITRDAITWNADGSDHWARIWIFLYVDDALVEDELVTHDGEGLVTHDGEELVALSGSLIVGGTVSDENAEEIVAVPREWSAAHVERTTVVLLYGAARLWNYAQPVPSWAAWGASGATWGGPTPVLLTIEG
ncbi:hypothetical protein DB32_003235 [Sandaracinus amylolyticus]|uniref:Uncharacterized protein n=1 Tax=Sandaracinus amylolyticus TaxID=927083 RepID=A0A0F6W2Z9_9BACT|nr:hypothetical protein DB32_003235 [Sandaracinus amylolyticus]